MLRIRFASASSLNAAACSVCVEPIDARRFGPLTSAETTTLPGAARTTNGFAGVDEIQAIHAFFNCLESNTYCLKQPKNAFRF
jgi:hypothetical protein